MAIPPNVYKPRPYDTKYKPIDEKLKHLQLEAKEESEELVDKESRKIVSETDRLLLADFNFKELRF